MGNPSQWSLDLGETGSSPRLRVFFRLLVSIQKEPSPKWCRQWSRLNTMAPLHTL